jgi:hypothetical protein
MHRAIYDQFGGVVRSVHVDRSEDRMVFASEQDVDPILRANERDRDVDQRGREFRLAARVPIEVVGRAMREGWYNDKAAWKRWLNNSENRAFRVWEGRV